MNKEDLVKSLRDISRTNSVSLLKRDICAEAADVIEELSKQVITWHDAQSDPPPEYVSVIGYIPNQYPFPTSRECFVTPKRTWFCQTLYEECEVTQWTEMPKYKRGDVENG